MDNAPSHPSANAFKNGSVEVPNREGRPVAETETTFWKVRTMSNFVPYDDDDDDDDDDYYYYYYYQR
jgi:hypothetical protein